VIKQDSHKSAYEAHRDYWRVRFIEKLKYLDDDHPDKDYYFEDGKIFAWGTGDREPLQERSLAVIYRFMDWLEGRTDLLQKEDNFTDKELDRLEIKGVHGLVKYIRESKSGIQSLQ